MQEVRAIWLLDAAGVILPEERKNELIEALDSKTPKLRAAFEAQLSQIRDEMVKDYMPPWKPPQTRTRFHR
ncbi:MAG: hypothetical protein LiPW16_88 [Microgenomates group bacterium LiPW_16]|nr:MAG: hypothetical protein LiPW16_88 [Microgenomates group bacterium LiPW_16]